MLEAAYEALTIVANPVRLLLLLAGMIMGGVIGMLPGLGGVAVVSILLPVIYSLDVYAGLAVLIGAVGVVYTADTITAVLVGTPGSPASAPSAIEGYALARQGQAARALSAAFVSSMLGGLVGALMITLSIPVAGPLVLGLGTAELFMFTVLGVYFASSILGGNRMRGLLSGLLGILLGTVGSAPAAAEFRFIFGQVYLMDGFPLVVVALGLFGITEIVSMMAQGGSIARTVTVSEGWKQGIKDVWAHRWLVVRGAVIGVIAGLIPAVGANASTWISYGQAVATSRDRSHFGKGDIRGIIAPESANNATVAADLIPTLLFSVPGGPAAAVFLGALFFYGYYPGPRFVLYNMDVMFVIVWSLVLASILGAGLCFLASPFLARITQVRFALVAPALLVVMVLGAYQSSRTLGDIAALAGMGLLGWVMKRAGWPRAPFLIGFVLAKPMESNFWLAWQLHGWKWLGFPGVLALMALMVIPPLVRVARGFRRRRLASTAATPSAQLPSAASASLAAVGQNPTEGAPDKGEGTAAAAARSGEDATAKAAGEAWSRQRSRFALGLSLFLFVLFLVALRETLGFFPDSRLVPLLAVIPGMLLSAVSAWNEWRNPSHDDSGDDIGVPEEERPLLAVREFRQLLILGAYFAAVALLGFYLPTAAFALLTLIGQARLPVRKALAYTALLLLFAKGVTELLAMYVPKGLWL